MKTTTEFKPGGHRHARRHSHSNASLLPAALADLPDPDDLDFEGLPERITARPLYDLDIDFAGADAPTHDLSSGRYDS